MTSIIGGTRLPKYHPRIEAYGTIDELIAWVGLLRGMDENKNRSEELTTIQAILMQCCAIVATDPSKPVTGLNDDVNKALEDSIDIMEAELPELDSFILPGGSQAVSFCHIARCVCRRAERSVLRLNETESAPSDVIKYLNRLADYLFVSARKIGYESDSEEVKWLPGKK